MGTKKGRRYFFSYRNACRQSPAGSELWLAGMRHATEECTDVYICQLITIGDRFSSFSELEA